MPRIAAIEIVEDRTAASRCDEGFLRLKRYTAVNRHADGTRSRRYPIDVIDRPSLDAVAVCLWARTPRGVEVLTRRNLRAAAGLRVDPARFEPLGGPFFVVPGIASEKIHLLAAEVEKQGPDDLEAPEHGDGSPLEQGAFLRWREIQAAIRACECGESEDAKTEMGFRRRAGRLGLRGA